MKTTILFFVLALVSGLLFYVASTFVPKPSINGATLLSKIFETDNGYGYIIVYKGKTLIRQKNIPAIQELKSFCSRDDASKIADLVVLKLEANEPPTVSREDLVSLRIKTNCLK